MEALLAWKPAAAEAPASRSTAGAAAAPADCSGRDAGCGVGSGSGSGGGGGGGSGGGGTCDVGAVDAEGRTALDLAREFKHAQVSEVWGEVRGRVGVG